MESFIYTLPQDRVQSELARAIHGKGAFRRFKDSVNYYGNCQQPKNIHLFRLFT